MYSESRNTEQGLTEVEASQSEGSGRSGRRLGRGLEDVSDAFLSYPVVEAVQPGVSEPQAPMPGQPARERRPSQKYLNRRKRIRESPVALSF